MRNHGAVSIRFRAASMARPLAPILLHLLLDAIHTGIELIQALGIILRLARRGLRLRRRGLRLRQRRFGGAVGFLQLCIERIDALADGSDLLSHKPFGGTSSQAQRTNQDCNRRGDFSRRLGHRFLPMVNETVKPKPSALVPTIRFCRIVHLFR